MHLFGFFLMSFKAVLNIDLMIHNPEIPGMSGILDCVVVQPHGGHRRIHLRAPVSNTV